MNKQIEYHLQLQVCKWLKLQHPEILFFSDLSGIKLTIGQAVKIKDLKCSRGIPDLIIIHKTEHYSGLVIEFKKNMDEVYDKKGNIRKEKHLNEQVDMLKRFEKEGFHSSFQWDFYVTKQLIENYLKI